MQTLSAARRRALTLIDQAPPIGLEVVDFWGSGWCRLRVKTPQGTPRIGAATYEWLKDQQLIEETRYGRTSTTGKERNRRYATLTDAGRAILAGSKIDDSVATDPLIKEPSAPVEPSPSHHQAGRPKIPATQQGRANIGECLHSPHGTWTVAESWIANEPGAQSEDRDYQSPFVSGAGDSHVYYLLTHEDGHQEEWSAPDMADFHRILTQQQQTLA